MPAPSQHLDLSAAPVSGSQIGNYLGPFHEAGGGAGSSFGVAVRRQWGWLPSSCASAKGPYLDKWSKSLWGKRLQAELKLLFRDKVRDS